uniref:NUDIX domain-containing protein n=1 Tax=Methylobacterium sp. B34 TaxID=95563 RepID=UPI0009FDD7A8|nr:NUDIX domain-containing protein [Methylobacterium sp. B34]
MNVNAVGPLVGCGAAVFEDGKILLVRRQRAPEAGCWGLPGGKVEPFEPVAEATAREIREELGIIIEPVDLLCVVDQIDRLDGQHWIAPVFRIDRYEGTPTIMEPDALSELGWFDLDHLPTTVTEATKQALAAMKRKAG